MTEHKQTKIYQRCVTACIDHDLDVQDMPTNAIFNTGLMLMILDKLEGKSENAGPM